MIYIKDYGALNSFVFEEWPKAAPPSYLNDLKGKLITVFTQNGNRATGILMEIQNDCIKLILSPPKAPNRQCRMFQMGRPLAVTFISIESICAVTYNEA